MIAFAYFFSEDILKWYDTSTDNISVWKLFPCFWDFSVTDICLVNLKNEICELQHKREPYRQLYFRAHTYENYLSYNARLTYATIRFTSLRKIFTYATWVFQQKLFGAMSTIFRHL